MDDKIDKLINKILDSRSSFGIESEKPLDLNNLDLIKSNYLSSFSMELDEEIKDFWIKVDGLDEGGYLIYSGSDKTVNGVEMGVFQNNEFLYSEINDIQNLIFLGESGMEFFVFDKSFNKFKFIDRYNFDNVIEEFDSFNQMLILILNLMLE